MLLSFVPSCNDDERDPSMIVDKSEIDVGFEGSVETIGVKTNRDWHAEADVDWIRMSHSSEEAFDAPSYILVTILPNDEYSRTGKITISSDKGGLVKEVTVNQGENTEVIRDADRFVEYLGLVDAGKATDGYRLAADIDLSGKTLPQIKSFDYAFDGQGHTISNWTSSAPFCESVGLKGAIKNLVFDSSCSVTVPAGATEFGVVAGENNGTISEVTSAAAVKFTSIAAGSFGAICGVNKGTVTGCTNSASFSYKGTEVFEEPVYFAGVAGNSAGSVTGCHNTGDVSLAVGGSKSVLYVAGVAGFVGGSFGSCTNTGAVSLFCESGEGLADGPVKGTALSGVAGFVAGASGMVSDCSNEGAVTFRAGYSLGAYSDELTKKFATNTAGVVGYAYLCGLSSCTNKGVITSVMKDIANEASVYQTTARQGAAGIISSTWGKVSGCENSGAVNVEWVTASHDAALVKQFIGGAAGISAGDYNSDTKSSSIENCTNSGDIDVVFDGAQSNSTFGGIVAWGGAESSSGVNVVSGCVNSGNITVDGFSKSRIGGIAGGAVAIKDCSNSGTVYLKGGMGTCAVGGINGFGNFFDVTGCTNTGTVRSDVLLKGSESSAAGGIGGLIGACGNTLVEHSGCKIDCAVEAPEGSAASMLLGVIGQNKNASNAKAIAIGTEASPMLIRGSFDGTVLTADNFEAYARRPDFELVNANVTFGVKYWAK